MLTNVLLCTYSRYLYYVHNSCNVWIEFCCVFQPIRPPTVTLELTWCAGYIWDVSQKGCATLSRHSIPVFLHFLTLPLVSLGPPVNPVIDPLRGTGCL